MRECEDKQLLVGDLQDLLRAQPDLLGRMMAAGQQRALPAAAAPTEEAGAASEGSDSDDGVPLTFREKLKSGDWVGRGKEALTAFFADAEPEQVFEAMGEQLGPYMANLVAEGLSARTLPHRQEAIFCSGSTIAFIGRTLQLGDTLSRELGTAGVMIFHTAPTQHLPAIVAPYALPYRKWLECQGKGRDSKDAFKRVDPFPLQALFHRLWHHPELCVPTVKRLQSKQQQRQVVMFRLLNGEQDSQLQAEVAQLLCAVLRYIVLQQGVVAAVDAELPKGGRVKFPWGKGQEAPPDVRDEAGQTARQIAEQLPPAASQVYGTVRFKGAKKFTVYLAEYIQLPGDVKVYQACRLALSTADPTQVEVSTTSLCSFDKGKGEWGVVELSPEAIQQRLQQLKGGSALAAAKGGGPASKGRVSLGAPPHGSRYGAAAAGAGRGGEGAPTPHGPAGRYTTPAREVATPQLAEGSRAGGRGRAGDGRSPARGSLPPPPPQEPSPRQMQHRQRQQQQLGSMGPPRHSLGDGRQARSAAGGEYMLTPAAQMRGAFGGDGVYPPSSEDRSYGRGSSSGREGYAPNEGESRGGVPHLLQYNSQPHRRQSGGRGQRDERELREWSAPRGRMPGTGRPGAHYPPAREVEQGHRNSYREQPVPRYHGREFEYPEEAGEQEDGYGDEGAGGYYEEQWEQPSRPMRGRGPGHYTGGYRGRGNRYRPYTY